MSNSSFKNGKIYLVGRSLNRAPTRAFPRCKIGGEGVDFYIYPTDSVERKALLDALKDLVVCMLAKAVTWHLLEIVSFLFL
jgi:hypothetical protein